MHVSLKRRKKKLNGILLLVNSSQEWEKNRAIIELNVEGKMLPIKRKSGSSSWDGT